MKPIICKECGEEFISKNHKIICKGCGVKLTDEQVQEEFKSAYEEYRREEG